MKVTLAGLVVALMLLLSVNLLSADSAFTASVNNNQNLTATGTTFLRASKGATTLCSSEPTGATVTSTSSFACSGTHLPPAVPSSTNATGDLTLASFGTTSFSSLSYSATSCAPVSNVNSVTSSNPMLVRGGIAYQTGAVTALAGSNSMGFNGTDAYSVGVLQQAPLTNFSVGVWFKSTSTSGGLLSWSDSPGNVAAVNYDRHVSLNGAGRISFGVHIAGTNRTVTTPAAYNDGNWHFVVAVAQGNTGGGGNNRSSLAVYVDGVQRVTNLFTGATPGGTYNGYWRVGQARALTTDGWTGTGSAFFNGSLSNFAVIPSALTAAQVASWNGSASQTAYQSFATSSNAANLWPLGDNGQTTYSGVLPGGAGDPCSHVSANLYNSTKCLYPPLGGACNPPANTFTLRSLSGVSVSIPVPPLGTPQTITVRVARNALYNTSYDPGLHLLVPFTVTTKGFGQVFTWSANSTVL